MHYALAGILALGALVLGTSGASAAPCTDEAAILSARRAVDEACACPTSGRRGFLRCARRAVKSGDQTTACKRAALKELANSLCGRSDQFVVCCEARGRRVGRIVRGAAKCRRGTVCETASRTPPSGSADPAFLSSVNDVCTSAGTCITTTTTTTTTSTTATTTTTSTTTTTTCPPADDGLLVLVVNAPIGTCGRVTSDVAGMTSLANLSCGGLNIGGGASGTLQAQATNGGGSVFGLRNCTTDVCDIVCSQEESTVASCTAAGCFFGAPIPIAGSPTTCVQNTFAAPATGTIDLAAGTTTDLSVSLTAQIHLTGPNYDGRPCPVCGVSTTDRTPVVGIPGGSALQGVCNGGPRLDMPCTTTNPDGLTADCQPGGTANGTTCEPGAACEDGRGQMATNLGTISVDLTPLRTDEVILANAEGLFCPEQTSPGCFGAVVGGPPPNPGAACRAIVATGSAFGDLRDALTHTGTLATVFCIPATSSPIVNGGAALPGPGETTLPGTLMFKPPMMLGR